ncbi:MAG: hypothetical protein KDC92_00350 [Bacteroidetes bacterium]|nr:hypothetical protein [Bacteroidota bacterium]
MNKNQLLDKLENLIEECHGSIGRMRVKDDIPAIEVGLLEKKLIDLYDQVQGLKLGAAKNIDSEDLEIEDISAKADKEMAEIVEKAEQLQQEVLAPQPQPVQPKETEQHVAKEPTEVEVVIEETESVVEVVEETVEMVSEPETVVETKPEPTRQEEAKTETPRPSPVATGKSLNDKIGKPEQQSLHQKLAATKEKQKEVSARFSGQPISDIKKAISINQQVIYTKELFGNDSKAFKKAIDFVNKSKNFSEAKSYLQFEVMPKFEFSEDNELYNELLATVKRKFI